MRAFGRWISDDVQLAFEVSEGDENIVVGMQLAVVTYWISLGGDPSLLENIGKCSP